MKYIPYIIIAVLIGVIFFGHGETEETHTTDTVLVTRNDTVFLTKLVEKERLTVDTFYILKDDGFLKLPKESKHYSEEGRFDAWVSGYEPSLDSLRVYNKTEYKTVTNTEAKNIYINENRIYADFGFQLICGKFSPHVGISISTPRKFKIGANIGLLGNDVTYGVNVGYKIN